MLSNIHISPIIATERKNFNKFYFNEKIMERYISTLLHMCGILSFIRISRKGIRKVNLFYFVSKKLIHVSEYKLEYKLLTFCRIPMKSS